MESLPKSKHQLKGVLEEIRALENRSKLNLSVRQETPLQKTDSFKFVGSSGFKQPGYAHFGAVDPDLDEAQEIMDELAMLYNHKMKSTAEPTRIGRNRPDQEDIVINDYTNQREMEQASGYHSFGTPLKGARNKSLLETSSKLSPDTRDHMTFRPVYPPHREETPQDLFEYTEEGVSIIAGPAAAGGIGVQSISLMDNSRSGLDTSGLEAFLQQHEASKHPEHTGDKFEMSIFSNKHGAIHTTSTLEDAKAHLAGYEVRYDAFKALESDLRMDTDPETRRLADFLYERRRQDIQSLEDQRVSDHFNFREGEDQFRDSARALVEREARTLRMLKDKRKARFFEEFQNMYHVATSRIGQLIDENKLLEQEILLGEQVNKQLEEFVSLQEDERLQDPNEETADVSIGGDSFYQKILGTPPKPYLKRDKSRPVSRKASPNTHKVASHLIEPRRPSFLQSRQQIPNYPSSVPQFSQSYFIVLESLLDLLAILKTRNAAIRVTNEVIFGSPGSDQGIIRRELPRLLKELDDKRLEFDHRFTFLFYSKLRESLRVRDSEVLESKHHLHRIIQRTDQIRRSLEVASSIVELEEDVTLNLSAVDAFLQTQSDVGSPPRNLLQTSQKRNQPRGQYNNASANEETLTKSAQRLQKSPAKGDSRQLAEIYYLGLVPNKPAPISLKQNYQEIKDLISVWLASQP